MIKNEKGFVITEVLILSTIIIGVLVLMFTQFKTINRSYQRSFKYDTPEGMYLANNIANYINENRYDYLVTQLTLKKNGYIDITDCGEKLYGLIGDVNNDGFINSVDASEILSLTSKTRNGEQLTDQEKIVYNRSDINEDGYVNEEDSDIVLHNYALIATSNYDAITNKSETKSYCNNLFEKSNIKQILFAAEDTSKINSTNLEQDFADYIRQIQTKKSKNDYRIIIKFTDGTFSSMRFNKEKNYVETGMVAFLDAIDNTGTGHSNTTKIWKDLTSNGNDITLYNNPTWTNKSIEFNGIDSYGRMEGNANDLYLNGLTLETRVKIKSLTQTDVQEFLGNWDTKGIGIKYLNDGHFAADAYSNESWHNLVNTSLSNLDEYYTVTITFSNKEISLYVNGRQIATQNISDYPLDASLAPIAIGGNPTVTGMESYNNIEVQNIIMYDRALTSEEVQRNYNVDLARY